MLVEFISMFNRLKDNKLSNAIQKRNIQFEFISEMPCKQFISFRSQVPQNNYHYTPIDRLTAITTLRSPSIHLSSNQCHPSGQSLFLSSIIAGGIRSLPSIWDFLAAIFFPCHD